MNSVYIVYATNIWKQIPATIYAVCKDIASLQKAVARGIEEDIFSWDDDFGFGYNEVLTIYELNQALVYGYVEEREVE